jgi:hypothetical protein
VCQCANKTGSLRGSPLGFATSAVPELWQNPTPAFRPRACAAPLAFTINAPWNCFASKPATVRSASQYSSGSKTHVDDRLACAITQILTPVILSVYTDISRNPCSRESLILLPVMSVDITPIARLMAIKVESESSDSRWYLAPSLGFSNQLHHRFVFFSDDFVSSRFADSVVDVLCTRRWRRTRHPKSSSQPERLRHCGQSMSPQSAQRCIS